MNELAEERRQNPTDDLTSQLVHNDLGEDMLAPNEIAPFFILLAVAGNDTTRTAISHGMHLLSQNPDQRRIWQDDLDGVTPTAVEEIVRVASPVTFMRRTATTDVTISGHDFVEGDKVVLLYGVANRDPRVFDDPEHFDVRRDPNPHVGFGGPGPHFCLGAHLARREVSVAFRQILARLPDIEVTSATRCRSSPWASRSSVGSSAWASSSRQRRPSGAEPASSVPRQHRAVEPDVLVDHLAAAEPGDGARTDGVPIEGAHAVDRGRWPRRRCRPGSR